MLAVEMRSCLEAHEELASVCIRTGIGHAQDAPASVLVGEVLIPEFCAEDTLATGAIACGKIATLSHEARNDSVEGTALKMEWLPHLAHALFTRAESAEVL